MTDAGRRVEAAANRWARLVAWSLARRASPSLAAPLGRPLGLRRRGDATAGNQVPTQNYDRTAVDQY